MCGTPFNLNSSNQTYVDAKQRQKDFTTNSQGLTLSPETFRQAMGTFQDVVDSGLGQNARRPNNTTANLASTALPPGIQAMAENTNTVGQEAPNALKKKKGAVSLSDAVLGGGPGRTLLGN